MAEMILLLTKMLDMVQLPDMIHRLTALKPLKTADLCSPTLIVPWKLKVSLRHEGRKVATPQGSGDPWQVLQRTAVSPAELFQFGMLLLKLDIEACESGAYHFAYARLDPDCCNRPKESERVGLESSEPSQTLQPATELVEVEVAVPVQSKVGDTFSIEAGDLLNVELSGQQLQVVAPWLRMHNGAVGAVNGLERQLRGLEHFTSDENDSSDSSDADSVAQAPESRALHDAEFLSQLDGGQILVEGNGCLNYSQSTPVGNAALSSGIQVISFKVDADASPAKSAVAEVSLMSGKTVSLQAHSDESVESLRARAQKALGAGRGRLLDSTGRVLDGGAPLKRARLQNAEPNEPNTQPEPLTLSVRRVDISGGLLAFAAILTDGCGLSWGADRFGGDCSAVKDQLKDVQQIHATRGAFAAILANGSVVTWGYDGGGESSAVRDQLKNVRQIQSTLRAFAAIRGDGSVVSWGDADYGGDSSAVRDQLKDVQQIQSTSCAFAAILADGSVVTWGSTIADYGGDSSVVRNQLKTAQHIQATERAFAAILGDGSVVTWGNADYGGDSSAVRDQLTNVQQIQATSRAFAAILGNGSVVTWGDAYCGGDSSAVREQLKNVREIQATSRAFAAILGDGSVVTWGDADYGGDGSAVRDQLTNVQQIQATHYAFAAILGNSSVVTWGNAYCGGDSSAVREELKNVREIQATSQAFAAILGDGSVVTWGQNISGGASSAVRDQLKNVREIQATSQAFAAILGDGSVVTWGIAESGGESSAVRDQLKSSNQ
ncbi:unnamed protein product [Symbiodinium sp. KB8]|nr:unnamed protein product [Symbiodinium sp. KB8]